MNKKIWAGSRNNHVGFADSESALIDQGYQNTTSFDVSGEVTNLKYITEETVKQPAPAGGSGQVTA